MDAAEFEELKRKVAEDHTIFVDIDPETLSTAQYIELSNIAKRTFDNGSPDGDVVPLISARRPSDVGIVIGQYAGINLNEPMQSIAIGDAAMRRKRTIYDEIASSIWGERIDANTGRTTTGHEIVRRELMANHPNVNAMIFTPREVIDMRRNPERNELPDVIIADSPEEGVTLVSRRDPNAERVALPDHLQRLMRERHVVRCNVAAELTAIN